MLELEAFDQYALGKPRIDRIEWRFIFDVNTVLANVLSTTSTWSCVRTTSTPP